MKTIEVVAAIIHQDGKILATQRGRDRGAGHSTRDKRGAERTHSRGAQGLHRGVRLPAVPPGDALLLVQTGGRGAGAEGAPVGPMAGAGAMEQRGVASGRCGGAERADAGTLTDNLKN